MSYEGEADDPKDSHMYALYDARNGKQLRLYKLDFDRSLACFEGGQSLTVLLRQKNSGAVEVGHAELP